MAIPTTFSYQAEAAFGLGVYVAPHSGNMVKMELQILF